MRKFFARWYRTETMWRREFAMQIIRLRRLANPSQNPRIPFAHEPVFNVFTGEIEIRGDGERIWTTLNGDHRYSVSRRTTV